MAEHAKAELTEHDKDEASSRSFADMIWNRCFKGSAVVLAEGQTTSVVSRYLWRPPQHFAKMALEAMKQGFSPKVEHNQSKDNSGLSITSNSYTKEESTNASTSNATNLPPKNTTISSITTTFQPDGEEASSLTFLDDPIERPPCIIQLNQNQLQFRWSRCLFSPKLASDPSISAGYAHLQVTLDKFERIQPCTEGQRTVKDFISPLIPYLSISLNSQKIYRSPTLSITNGMHSHIALPLDERLEVCLYHPRSTMTLELLDMDTTEGISFEDDCFGRVDLPLHLMIPNHIYCLDVEFPDIPISEETFINMGGHPLRKPHRGRVSHHIATSWLTQTLRKSHASTMDLIGTDALQESPLRATLKQILEVPASCKTTISPQNNTTSSAYSGPVTGDAFSSSSSSSPPTMTAPPQDVGTASFEALSTEKATVSPSMPLLPSLSPAETPGGDEITENEERKGGSDTKDYAQFEEKKDEVEPLSTGDGTLMEALVGKQTASALHPSSRDSLPMEGLLASSSSSTAFFRLRMLLQVQQRCSVDEMVACTLPSTLFGSKTTSSVVHMGQIWSVITELQAIVRLLVEWSFLPCYNLLSWKFPARSFVILGGFWFLWFYPMLCFSAIFFCIGAAFLLFGNGRFAASISSETSTMSEMRIFQSEDDQEKRPARVSKIEENPFDWSLYPPQSSYELSSFSIPSDNNPAIESFIKSIVISAVTHSMAARIVEAHYYLKIIFVFCKLVVEKIKQRKLIMIGLCWLLSAAFLRYPHLCVSIMSWSLLITGSFLLTSGNRILGIPSRITMALLMYIRILYVRKRRQSSFALPHTS